ncbi:CU044_2847 family protein [Streptomyces sp. NPDC048309]|uniref:CU044_2847 family protein n=1 Tax=unclassified Streptomyces TaxID=2593676 RepID=UPI0033D114D0
MSLSPTGAPVPAEDSSSVTRVEVGDAVLFVQATPLGGTPQRDALEDEEVAGIVPDLSGVTSALSTFAGQLNQAFHQAAPQRATVEFGCQLAVESGKLTALIVKGSAAANLKVTLEWSRPTP